MTCNLSVILEKKIIKVHHWPKKNIVFYDLMPVIRDADIFHRLMRQIYLQYQDISIDKVVAVEARGFIFGSILSNQLKSGFIPVRKQGKLPSRTLKQNYKLEYGTGQLEVSEDCVKRGEKILIFDDVLATGGTAVAVANLMKTMGAHIVGCAFVLEIKNLRGCELLREYDVFSYLKL